jgi:putative ABC transport system ATP-binding protein
MMLEVQGLNKTYGKGVQAVRVLQNLELRVQSGELAVIAGRSGSGKTTLLHCLAGLDLPDSGDLSLLGLQLNATSNEIALLKWRRTISFLHQTPILIPTLNAWENVLLPFRYAKQTPDLAWVKELFSRLGLTGLERRRPQQLSGGQATRVALARALARRSPLILADEPTGRLDAQTAEDVWQLLHEICHDQKIAIVVVTHDPIILERTSYFQKLEAGKLVPVMSSAPVQNDSLQLPKISDFSSFNSEVTKM